MGDGAGAGGEAACCPPSGAGVGAGGAVGAGGVGTGGAAASCAADGGGEGGGEGAAFCTVGAGADEGAGSWATGAGVTDAGPGETGGATFVWLLAVQKTVAIATRTTPPSKAHNQRDMTFPSRRLELSPMMGDPHPSVESVGRAVARRDIRRRQSITARA